MQSMAQRTFNFEPLLWKTATRSREGVLLGALLMASAGWVALYAWLGWLLWLQGIAGWRSLHTLLLAASIGLGVALAQGWRAWMAGGLSRGPHRRALNLEQLQMLEPGAFEAYVAERLFTHRGYHAANTRDTKDGGIDVLVTDRFGQTAVVQCKRYRGTVGEAVVRDLYGTMMHAGATYGYLVTTGAISDEARRWALGKPIQLIDGPQLVELTKSNGIL
jgi:restriction system protein